MLLTNAMEKAQCDGLPIFHHAVTTSKSTVHVQMSDMFMLEKVIQGKNTMYLDAMKKSR